MLDVGCGPGGLATRALADIVGEESVAAVDPSEPFVEASRSRVPGADVRVGAAEELPFENGVFDAALAELVVNFMAATPSAAWGRCGASSRKAASLAACTWDYANGMKMLRTFWDAALEVVLDELAAPVRRGRSPMRYCTARRADRPLGVRGPRRRRGGSGSR